MRAPILRAINVTILTLLVVSSALAQQVTTEEVAGIRNLRRLETTVACSGAVSLDAVPEIRKMGFVSIVNLRLATEPGAEVEKEAAAAKANGLKYFHVPFDGSPDPKAADQFVAAITSPGAEPAFIHCGGGNRAATMWLIKRLAVDGWDVDRATQEAIALGQTSLPMRKFAIDYAQSRGSITAAKDGIKELIDNQRVLICEVTLTKGRQWPMEQYEQDTLMIALAPVSLTLTTADRKTTTVNLKQGEVAFWPKGTHQAVVPGNDARTIVAHFKEFTAQPYQNTTGYGPAFPRPRAKKLLENDRIGVWDYTWVKGQPTPNHFHDKDLMIVYMADGAIQSVTPDGKAAQNEFTFAEVRFNLGNRAHYEEYLRGDSPRAIITEFK